MPHLDEGTLHALVDGEIRSTELEPIRAHLGGCAECRAQLDEARIYAGEAAGLVELVEVPPAGPGVDGRSGDRRRFPMRELAWAASVVAAVGLGYVGGRGTSVSAPVVVAAVPEQPRPARQEPALPSPREHRSPEPVPARADKADREVAGNIAAPQAAQEMVTPSAPAVGGVQPAAKAAESKLALRRELGASGPAPVFAEVSFAQAVERLGGGLRLVEGLVPLRLEAAGDVVRVIYAAADGELVLEQRRAEDEILTSLRGPASVGPDSLARLRSRIR
jgi:hypothetical protein